MLVSKVRSDDPAATDGGSRKRTRVQNVVLGVTGSVAAIKGPEIAVKLVNELNANVRVVLTKGGENFWHKGAGYNHQYWAEMMSFTKEVPARISVVDADDEWKGWNEIGDPVLHIQLRDWADALVIAPLSAHSLAKISHGLCDDTLSCVMRAWDFGHGLRPGKPVVLAPAMNTAMWEHPLTVAQLDTVKSFWNAARRGGDNEVGGVVVVDPQVKVLACGEVGVGALASVEDIISTLGRVLTDSDR